MPAAASSSGSISGVVTNAATHAPISGLEVAAYGPSSSTIAGETFTDSSGAYTLANLPAGSYKIGFETTSDIGGNYIPQYYSHEPSLAAANSVAVAAGATSSSINATMHPGAAITGMVTDAVTHKGFFGATVSAYFASSGKIAGHATTDSSGAYTISQLPAGAYKVLLSDYFYKPQYYNDKASLSTANAVSVNAGATASKINAAMVKKPVGKIAGTVTDVSSHAALPGTFVAVLDRSTGAYVTSVYTGTGGRYTLAAPAGTYKVEFSKGGYLDQFFTNEPTFARANVVTVVAHSTTSGVSAALHLAGRITGSVTDATSGKPIAGAAVVIYDAATSQLVSEVSTATNGQWSLGGLQTGTYKACFAYIGSDYAPQCYSGKPSEAAANSFSVHVGATTSGISAALRHGAKISGTVTDATTHIGIGGVHVIVYDASGNEVGEAFTGGGGGYVVMGGTGAVGLQTGTYKVGFSDNGYIAQYYNGRASLSSADPVQATEGQTTPGIDASLQSSP